MKEELGLLLIWLDCMGLVLSLPMIIYGQLPLRMKEDKAKWSYEQYLKNAQRTDFRERSFDS